MDEIIEITKGSEAWDYLKAVVAHPSTYCVRIHVREDGIAVKQNEGMWTATLSTTGAFN